MIPIENALKSGDYETANLLYHDIEVNPPFSGSRFYEKLRLIRYSVEYYRNFRYAFDIYKNPTINKNWIIIRDQLKIPPPNFPDKEIVTDILNTANKDLSK